MTRETAEHAPALLQLDADTASVVAGGLSTLHGLIRTQSSVADSYDLRVVGLPEPWAGVAPIAGEENEQRFELALTPPRTTAAAARPWPFTLEAVSRESGRVAARVNATMIVKPYEDLVARAHLRRRRGRAGKTFAIDVINCGNAPSTVRLAATGSDDACDIRVDPPALRVAAGARVTARVRVAPRRTLWLGSAVEHRIDVEAPVPQVLAFRQLPWLRWRVPALMLFAMLALTATPQP